MDAFSLLRYWRSNGGGGGGGNGNDSTNNASTIVTAVSTQTSDTEEEDDENDHGPFFDLEFSLQEEAEAKIEENENGVVLEEDEDDESDGSEEEEAENVVVTVSPPSDDLFFKGGVVPVDRTTSSSDELKGKECQSQSRVSLMKSATKLRVMMLKFNNNNNKSNLKNEEEKKLGQIRENEVEQVPIVSLFKRHNSAKIQKKRQNDVDSVTNEEKKFSKEAMQRYLRKVKPLYVRVSKRYGDKLKFSGQLKQTLAPALSPSTTEQSPAAKETNLEVPLLTSNGNGKGLKQGNLPAGLRVVCKHLGKSRSASTAVVAAAPPGAISSKRRDDSLLQQQDGIQSAILHCKRSFKASRDSDCSSNLSSESVAGYGNSSSSEAAETVEIRKGGNDSQKAGN